jgi:hypothetical protein
MPMTAPPHDLAARGLLVEHAAAVDRRHHACDADEPEVLVDADLDEVGTVRTRRCQSGALGLRTEFPERAQLGKLVSGEDVDVGLADRPVVLQMEASVEWTTRLGR